MKLNNLRQLVKEELTKVINENTPKYKEGDTFNYFGTKHIVVSDDGFVIKAKTPSGKVVKINYNQLKNRVSENESERDFKDVPLKNMAEGTYNIDYIVADSDGGPDYSDSTTIAIPQNEFEQWEDAGTTNFWKGIARDAAGFKIYKVTKVTKA
jgi:hypothetical protein